MVKIIKQLGHTGSEATVYLAESETVQEKFYAVRVINKPVSADQFRQEVAFQKVCAQRNISPHITFADEETQTIMMDCMDSLLVKYINSMHKLKLKHQEDILFIFKTLDELKIFHGDANLLNYMVHNGCVYIVDFGMAKHIDNKLISALGTSTPNMDLGLLSFMLKLRERHVLPSGYKRLKQALSPEMEKLFMMRK